MKKLLMGVATVFAFGFTAQASAQLAYPWVSVDFYREGKSCKGQYGLPGSTYITKWKNVQTNATATTRSCVGDLA